MSLILSDLHSARRVVLRSPLFSSVAIAILSLGIAGTTTLFSLVDSVLLQPLPFKDSDRLVEISGQEGSRTGMRVPAPILDMLVAKSRTIDSIAVYGPVNAVMQTSEGTLDVPGNRVSANFFDVLGVRPMAGRGFLPEDERPGAPAVMLVSFGFWQQQLNGDATAIGRPLYLGGTAAVIIGIMPPEFRTSFRGLRREFWTTHVPKQVQELERTSGYELIGRLSAGATIDAARREARSLATSVSFQEWIARSRTLAIHSLKDEVVRDSGYALILVFASVGALLLIACANVAQLLLARADERINDFGIRKALGAHPLQLVRLALVESLLIAIGGGICGLVLAKWLLPLTLSLAPGEIPRLNDAALNGRAVATGVGLSIFTAIMCGLLPALRVSRPTPISFTKGATNRASNSRRLFRYTLVIVQIAASVPLIALAGVLVRSFVSLLPTGPGFEITSRAVFLMSVPSSYLPSVADRLNRMQELKRRLESRSVISTVALASNIPFSGDQAEVPVRPAEVASEKQNASGADVRFVSPEFFHVLEMPMVVGRTFVGTDGPRSARVAVVNQRLARELYGMEQVIGRRIRIGSAAATPEYEIVGVVKDVRADGTSRTVLSEVYLPYAQGRSGIVYLVFRTPLDPMALTKIIRADVHEVFPGLPIRLDQRARAMSDLVRRSVAGPRFTATMMGGLSFGAIVLAAVGLFGLVAYSVSQRRHELALRVALGALPHHIVLTSMREAATVTIIGVCIGLMCAWYATGFIRSQLYLKASIDVPILVLSAVGMTATACCAAYLAARRGVNADSVAALRND